MSTLSTLASNRKAKTNIKNREQRKLQIQTLERRRLLAAEITYLSPTIDFSIYDPNTGLGGNDYVEVSGSFAGATNKTDDIIDFNAMIGEYAPEIHGDDIPALLATSGDVLYPIDSTFGFEVRDFDGAEPKVLDGVYQEGWVGNQYGEGGELSGLLISNVETDTFKSSLPLGTWAAGLGGNSVKASTEHYVVMSEVLGLDGDPRDDVYREIVDGEIDPTAYTYEEVGAKFASGEIEANESTILNDIFVVYQGDADAGTVAESPAYSITFKDDGKLLYRWGTMIKRPNDVRLGVHVPLPEAWTTIDSSQPGFVVTSAELRIRHTITNNPNDQIRPEDLENELATGRKPSYQVAVEDLGAWDGNFYWYSDVTDYSGDGSYLPSYMWLDGTGDVVLVDASDLTAPAGYLGYTTGEALAAEDIVHLIMADDAGNPILDGLGNPQRVTMLDGTGAEIDAVGLRNKEEVEYIDETGMVATEIVTVGTMFRDTSLADPTALSSDIRGGLTWEYYTSMDRDPFEPAFNDAGEQLIGPRWRFLANKFGQDIPGVEIPLIPGSEPPFQKDNIKYEVGLETVTTIDLLDGAGLLDSGIDLRNSNHWVYPVTDGELGDPRDPDGDGISENGLPLTEAFDFAIYIKGDRKPVTLYDVQLVLSYEVEDPTAVTSASEPLQLLTATPVEALDEDASGGDSTGYGENLQRLTPLLEDIDGDGGTEYVSPLHQFSTLDVAGDFAGNTVADDSTILDTTGLGLIEPIITKEGVTLYPIDSEFGFNTIDFVGGEAKTRDGLYGEGWVGDWTDPTGVPVGIQLSDAETDLFKSGLPLGTWLSGLGGDTVKASTEHYRVMANVLGFDESPADDIFVQMDLTYDPVTETYTPGVDHLREYTATQLWDAWLAGEILANESSVIQDIFVARDIDEGQPIYSVTFKDDGKLLYRWGTAVKKPNDIRMNASLALPEAWTATGLTYEVTTANLRVNHKITNNPNDQIRPEDLENELAKGRKPSYVIVANPNDAEGYLWVSALNDYAGDGTYLPSYFLLSEGAIVLPDATTPEELVIYDLDGNAIGVKNQVESELPDGTIVLVDGTIFRDTTLVEVGGLSSDLSGGYTNAWYTTMDRDPFEPNEQYTPELFDVVSTPTEDFNVLNVPGSRWRLQPGKFGQDLPGVDIPLIPHSRPPFTSDNIKYEVGLDTTTVINLLDGAGQLDNGVDLRESTYWVGVVRDETGAVVDERLAVDEAGEHITRTEENGSTSYLTTNGVWLSEGFDFAVYIKGDRKPTALYDAQLVAEYEIAVEIVTLPTGLLAADFGDVPDVTYEWYVNGTPVGSESTFDLAEYIASNPDSSYVVELFVTDSYGTEGSAAYTAAGSITSSSIGLYQPDVSFFHLKETLTSGDADLSFAFGPGGDAGWAPLSGDWNNDGIDTIGLYEPGGSLFHLKDSFSGGDADYFFAFGPGGNQGWIPLTGDWNGDGIDTVGLYQPENSVFHLKDSFSGGASDHFFAFGPAGNAGWTPLAGDWNGDGIDTIGLYQPDISAFHLKNTFSGGDADQFFLFGPSGDAGWTPVTGDWDGDTVDTIGLYQPDIALFHLKDSFTGGASDYYVTFGPVGNAGWIPLTGDWDGPELVEPIIETIVPESGVLATEVAPEAEAVAPLASPTFVSEADESDSDSSEDAGLQLLDEAFAVWQ